MFSENEDMINVMSAFILALPGGYRNNNGTYNNIGNNGNWWSATENNSNNAWYRNLYYLDSDVYRYYDYKRYGFSIRCVKD